MKILSKQPCLNTQNKLYKTLIQPKIWAGGGVVERASLEN